jgi:glucose-1-phosphate thymidylyltransferase
VTGFLGDVIEKHVRETYPDLPLNVAPQEEMLGLGHAISLGKPFHEKDEKVLIILGDTILRADFKAMLASQDTVLGVKEVDDPRRFGVVELDGDGKIKAMLEKPKNPPTKMAIVGVYMITDPALLFAKLDEIIEEKVTTAGEIQLTDALARMLAAGHVMRPFAVEKWLDCGKPETLFDTNRQILDETPPLVLDSFRLQHPGAMIIPPVFIGDSCDLEECVIGPYTVLGNECVVRRSVVSDSIVGARTKITDAVIKDGLVGSDCELAGKAASPNVGDTSVVAL